MFAKKANDTSTGSREDQDDRDLRELKHRILNSIEEYYGSRCLAKDYDDFPDIDFAIGDPDTGRCPTCLVYEKFDAFWKVFDINERN